MFDLNNPMLLKEWNKIKTANIFLSLEEFAEFYYKNGEKSCYRKFTSEPWSKENFFFGTYQELLAFYKTDTTIPLSVKAKIGQKFYSLTVLDIYAENPFGKKIIYAKCKCDCGNETIKTYDSLIKGDAHTYGCNLGQGYKQTKKLSQKVIDEFWDYDKNRGINPQDLDANSVHLYWWKDSDGNSYQLAPYVFAKETSSTSFPEQAIYYYVKKYFPSAINRANFITSDGEIFEIDIFIPTLNIGIEYDGLYWHKNKLDIDNNKNQVLNENGISLFRVRETGLPEMNPFQGKVIERNIPFSSDETLICAINTLLREINTVFGTNKKLTKVNLLNLNNARYDIYALLNSVPVNNSVANSPLIDVWDTKKNASLKADCVPIDTHIPINFSCKNDFTLKVTPAEILERNKNLKGLNCQLSDFCKEDYQRCRQCEFFCNDVLLRASHKLRNINGNSGYICRSYVSGERFLEIVMHQDSFLYKSDISYERLLKFIILCSFDYETYYTRETIDFIYDSLLNQDNISIKKFFEQVREELRVRELYLLLENERVCQTLIQNSDFDYCVSSLICITDRFYTEDILFLARNFILVAKHFSKEDLKTVCNIILSRIGEENWHWYIAEIRNIAKTYLLKNLIDEKFEKVLFDILGQSNHIAKPIGEESEENIKQRAYNAIKSNCNTKVILRECISELHTPTKEEFLYELYKNNLLDKIGVEYRINGNFFRLSDLDFTFISNKNELIDIMEILGMKAVLFKLSDYDAPNLRERFVRLCVLCCDADWAKFTYAGGFCEQHFRGELNLCLDSLSEEFITLLFLMLKYVSSHRRLEAYYRIELDDCIKLLGTRCKSISPSQKSKWQSILSEASSERDKRFKDYVSTNIDEVPATAHKDISVTAEEVTEVAEVNVEPLIITADLPEAVLDIEKSTIVRAEVQPSLEKSETCAKQGQKIVSHKHKTQSKQKVNQKAQNEPSKKFIGIAVAILLVIIIAIIAVVSGIDKKTNDGYVDLTNAKSVNFELNSDDTYTMKQAWGFLSQPKLPEILKIPETYEGKAVTKVDWFTSAYEIKKIIGSKNLITIEAHAFADSSGSSKMELHEVIFPQDGSLKEIKNWGFFNCRKLQTVVVPENFKSFGEGAFLYCISLSNLVIYSLEPPTGAEGLFTEGIYEYKTPAEFKVYVPDEAIEIYKLSAWGAYTIHGISELDNVP